MLSKFLIVPFFTLLDYSATPGLSGYQVRSAVGHLISRVLFTGIYDFSPVLYGIV